MASVNLGRVGLVLRGDWSATTNYVPLDVVTYNGNSFAAKAASINTLPTNTTYWQPLAQNSEYIAQMEEYLAQAQEYAETAEESSEAAAKALANQADVYSNQSTYSAGDYVLYEGVLYRCLNPITAPENWTPANWETIKFGGALPPLQNDTNNLKNDIGTPFSTTADYSSGDFVMYNGILYRFTESHPAGAWTGEDVSQVSIAGDFLPRNAINIDNHTLSIDTDESSGEGNSYLDKVIFNGLEYDIRDSEGREMIAPEEATSTASRAYAVGELFIYNDLLYRATAAIAQGGTITPGTNCETVPGGLGGEVGELKRATNQTRADVDEMNVKPVTETETENKYLNTNKSVGTTLGNIVVNSNNWNFYRFQVNEGDRFMITGTGGSDPLLWAFTDEGTTPSAEAWMDKGCKLLSKGGQRTTLTDEVITAPDDGWLLVNHKKSDTFSLRTLAVNPLAQQVATAQATATDAKNTAESLLFNASVTSAWENGTILNGSNSSNDARLRTKTYIQTSARKVAASGTYDFAVIAFDASAGTYAGCIKADGTIGIPSSFTWHTSVDLSGYTGYKFRLILRNSADTSSAMDVSESSNCTILCYTDDSLAFSGAAADAKATGDRLDALDTEAQYGHYQVRRNNPEYVSAMLTVAQSYMAANSDTILRNSKHFEYGNNSILQVSTSTNLIDCSTFVGLVLRGYSLTDTSYMADVSLRNPAAWVAKSGVAWAIDPFDFKVVSKPGEDPSRLRWAAQLAQWMIERSQVVPMTSGLAEVMPGDILFWARKNPETGAWVEPLRYRHISHVGFCLSRTKTPDDDPDVDATVYPYKHMTIEAGRETYDTDGTTVLTGCVRSKLLEAEPDDPADYETTNNIHTLVLVCRPDLGSI